MLLYMSSHDDFLGFLRFGKRSLGKDQIRRLQDPSFKRALLKVNLVNTDLVQDLIFPLYSLFGRPANDPSLYIRSMILMQHFGYTSIDKWCTAVANDSLLQYLIGSWNVPGVACHYDFISRITQDDPHLGELYAKGLFNKEPLKKLRKEQKLKKNDKLINFTPQTTVDFYELYIAHKIICLLSITSVCVKERNQSGHSYPNCYDYERQSFNIAEKRLVTYRQDLTELK